MSQSRTRHVGLDVHNESMALASAAAAHQAEAISRGAIGTRHGDIDSLIRQLHSNSPHLVFADEAGPCGYWL